MYNDFVDIDADYWKVSLKSVKSLKSYSRMHAATTFSRTCTKCRSRCQEKLQLWAHQEKDEARKLCVHLAHFIAYYLIFFLISFHLWYLVMLEKMKIPSFKPYLCIETKLLEWKEDEMSNCNVCYYFQNVKSLKSNCTSYCELKKLKRQISVEQREWKHKKTTILKII